MKKLLPKVLVITRFALALMNVSIPKENRVNFCPKIKSFEYQSKIGRLVANWKTPTANVMITGVIVPEAPWRVWPG